ncbi:hypothetical protein Nepgr_009108 [Nepenthes gracilis]|uniref:NAC domain-containing protein n=1 Tax=Nepenthes gracilis TaxID=150966 RepID=A0AAD3SA18_NEPGR|nr:hypothetical protein Nepgr_009108 [Nepenthes gracilis]
MTWSWGDCSAVRAVEKSSSPSKNSAAAVVAEKSENSRTKSCPSCGYQIKCQEQGKIKDLNGLPMGVRFDPNDQELLQHLERKVRPDDQLRRLHPLIDEFIPTLEGENGICCTHPEKLPGVRKDGQVRHFFHRPSKAYTTGTRKRRKVHTGNDDGSETRWHKTGKTRSILVDGKINGYKKILVLYTNYGKQKKPEKTNWVMHQYHLGGDEEEKDGEIVVSKVFYQTQPRHCGSASLTKSFVVSPKKTKWGGQICNQNDAVERCKNHSSVISFELRSHNRAASPSAAMFPFCCP